jgi:hypothetical protein
MSTPSDEQLKELEGLYQKRGQSDNDRILYEMDLRNKAPALLSTIQALRTELAAWRERGQGLREALDKVFWSAVMAEGEAGYLLGDIKQITQDALSQPPQSPWRLIETAPKDGTDILLWTCQGIIQGYWRHGAWDQSIIYSTYDGAGGPAFEAQPTHWQPLLQPPTEGGKV